jgi:hypothetical protein
MAKGNALTNPVGAISGAFGGGSSGGNSGGMMPGVKDSPLGGMAGGSNMQPQMRGMAPGNFGNMNKTFAGGGGGNMNGVNGQPLGPGPDLGKGGNPYYSQQAVQQRGGNTGIVDWSNGGRGTHANMPPIQSDVNGPGGMYSKYPNGGGPDMGGGGMQPQIQPWRENTGRMGGWGGGGYRDNMPRMRMGGQQPQMPVMMNDSPMMKAIQDGTFNPRDYAQPNGGMMHPMDKGGGNSDYYEKGIGQPNLFPGLGGNFNPGNMRDMMGSAPMGGFGNPRAWG